jgi:hypothetical protein
MAETLITTRKVKPYEVGLGFTRDLQGLAQEAWTAALDGIRDPDEIKRAFNPNDPVLVTEAQKQYKAFARHGRLIVAREGGYGPTIAYAMARNDVSPKGPDPLSLALRTGKRTLAVVHNHLDVVPIPLKIRNVVAWEKHVVAKPDAPKGMGTAVVKASLEEDFYPDQESAAYIDDENEQSREFFAGLGYKLDEKYVKPPVYRFGEENDPTTQRRYIAPVQVAIGRAAAILAELDVQVSTAQW